MMLEQHGIAPWTLKPLYLKCVWTMVLFLWENFVQEKLTYFFHYTIAFFCWKGPKFFSVFKRKEIFLLHALKEQNTTSSDDYNP